MRYSLADFNKILETITISDLPDTTINIINTLATQVGAPEYIKTPQFKNKSGNENGIITNTSGVRRRKKYQILMMMIGKLYVPFRLQNFKKRKG